VPPSLHPFRWDAVCFDVDGTLYPLWGLKLAIGVFKGRDLPLWLAMEKARKAARLEPRWSTPGPDEPLASHLDAETALIMGQPVGAVAPRLHALMEDDWPRLLAAVGPDPAADGLLRRLAREGVHFSAASDYPPTRKLAGLGLLHHPWHALLGASEMGLLKPAPAFFQAAADAHGVPPDRVLYVGDSPTLDVTGARAIGMSSVLVGGAQAEPPADFHYRDLAAFHRAIAPALAARPPTAATAEAPP
jgi:HAD superfamily hydrolase (TIGR01549 family)